MGVPQLELTAIEVRGWRKALRVALHAGVVVGAAWAAAGYLFGTHSIAHWCGPRCVPTAYGSTHPLWDDFGPGPVVALVVVALGQLAALRGRMLAGIFAGAGSVGVAMVLGVNMLVAHLYYRDVTFGTAAALWLVGGLGAVQIGIEAILAQLERTAREALEPKFPPAIVVPTRRRPTA